LLAENPDALLPTAVTGKELKEQIDAENGEVTPGDEKEAVDKEEDEHVPAKKIKLDEESESKEGPSNQVQQNGTTTADNLEQLRQMYESKYVSIPSRLKGYSYAKVTIFQTLNS
jgi:hypothetical protein